MNKLSQANCEVCTNESPRVTDEELKELMHFTPDWEIEVRNDILQLEKTYKFKNFVQALAFTNEVGMLAEQHAHHPGLLTEWGKVTVTWWTHSVHGLHRNDFIMAAKTDSLYSNGN